ncbi:MAG TPA: holo-ACP synthase [Gemmatimonadaceae bacterium]|nr:holo-ACP synthase [Gemmatimonadaceae bacterium]
MIVGMGIDLVEIARMRRLLAAQGDRALARLFTDGEVAYAMRRSEPVRHLAARVAAKEATFKALSGSAAARGIGIGWRDMEVVVHEDGRPMLMLHGAAECRATELAVACSWVTLSHSEGTAAAVVVLERA